MMADLLPLAVVERALGERAPKWKGRCYEIACRIVEKGLVDDGATAVYGHWLGPVHKKSMFYRGGVMPFVQHGWIALPDGRVLDPTRWAFEHVKPYLFIGKPNGEYDEGGNEWRAALRNPVPEWDADEEQIELTQQILPKAAWNFVERYLRLDEVSEDGYAPGFVTRRQLCYLANAPLTELGKHAKDVYDALVKLGEEALIPLDNKKRVQLGRWP